MNYSIRSGPTAQHCLEGLHPLSFQLVSGIPRALMFVQGDLIHTAARSLTPPAEGGVDSGRSSHGRFALHVLRLNKASRAKGTKVGVCSLVTLWLLEGERKRSQCECLTRRVTDHVDHDDTVVAVQPELGMKGSFEERKTYVRVMSAHVMKICWTNKEGQEALAPMPACPVERPWLENQGKEVLTWVDAQFCSKCAPPKPAADGKLQPRSYYPSADNVL